MTTETAILVALLALGIGMLAGWLLSARAASTGAAASLEATAVSGLTKAVEHFVSMQATSPAQQVEVAAAAARRSAAIDAAVAALSKLKTTAP